VLRSVGNGFGFWVRLGLVRLAYVIAKARVWNPTHL